MADPNDQYTDYYPGGSPPSGVKKVYYPGGSAPPRGGPTAAVKDRMTTAANAPLNASAILALADTTPERNPRAVGGETIAKLYREVARLNSRVNYLEQN